MKTIFESEDEYKMSLTGNENLHLEAYTPDALSKKITCISSIDLRKVLWQMNVSIFLSLDESARKRITDLYERDKKEEDDDEDIL